MQNNYRTKINVEGAVEEEETVKNDLTFLDFGQNSKWKGDKYNCIKIEHSISHRTM